MKINQEIYINIKNRINSYIPSFCYLNNSIEYEKYYIFLLELRNCLDNLLPIQEQEIQELILENLIFNLKQRKYQLGEQYSNEKWIDVHISLLSNLENDLKTILQEESSKNTISTKNHSISSIKKVIEKYSPFKNKDKSHPESIDDLKYKPLCESIISQLIDEYQICSFQIMDFKNWKNLYFEINNLDIAIKSSMKLAGLSHFNLGCYNSLNIVLSYDYLSKNNWSGFQSKTNTSFSIFINPSCEMIDLKKTWIHEYTHFLDRMSAHSFYLENFVEHNISTFSHLALEYLNNNQPIHNKPLKIMAEMLSSILAGTDSNLLSSRISTSIKTIKDTALLNFIYNILPLGKADWDSLSITERQIILSKCKLNEAINFIFNEISNHPSSIFALNEQEYICAFDNRIKINSGISIHEITESICSKISKFDFEILHNLILTYVHHKLFDDIKNLMKEHNLIAYKDTSVYSEKFFVPLHTSIGQSSITLQENSNLKYSYYDIPLEILARMSEMLIEEDNSELKHHEKYLIETTLQSMSRYIGIENNTELNKNQLEQIFHQLNNSNILETVLINIENLKNEFFNQSLVAEKRRLV